VASIASNDCSVIHLVASQQNGKCSIYPIARIGHQKQLWSWQVWQWPAGHFNPSDPHQYPHTLSLTLPIMQTHHPITLKTWHYEQPHATHILDPVLPSM